MDPTASHKAFLIPVKYKKKTVHKSVWFSFIDHPAFKEIKEYLEQVLQEQNEEIKNYNLRYAYRLYLNAQPYPPLACHRYMFDECPEAPFNKNEKEPEQLE